MAATVIKLKPKAQPAQLQCSSCGALADGACDCGVAYVPVGVRASEVVAKNPEKSSRALSDETGIPRRTLDRARGGSNDPRVGLDGKSYRAKSKPRKRKAQCAASEFPDINSILDEPSDDTELENRWQHSLSNLAGSAITLRAYWSKLFGKWEDFEPTPETVELAKQAATEWCAVSDLLKKFSDDVEDDDDNLYPTTKDEYLALDQAGRKQARDNWRAALLARIVGATYQREDVEKFWEDSEKILTPDVKREVVEVMRTEISKWSSLLEQMEGKIP
jgi:hypothetical protein